MKGDTGPHPHAQWLEECPQWNERYDYIVSRAETYFDHYRDNPDYDFTKGAERQKIATELAYRKYATGTLTIEGVEAQVKMLRVALRRAVTEPARADVGDGDNII